MNYRTAKLLAETNYDAAATKTIEINVKDLISRITIAWRVSASQHGMSSYTHRDISKIELVDGSEVLHSLNGGENQALCIYDRKVPTMNHGQSMSGSSTYSVFGIDFGRYLHDPMYAFDPTRFNNPQLKITFNFAVAEDGASSGNLEVLADLFDEKNISPVGYLSAREIKDYTVTTAGVYDYVDIPVDKVMRKLFIQGYLSAYEPWNQVIEARLSEDSDKRVPFDWDLEDYYRIMKGVWRPVVENVVFSTTAGACTIYTTPTDYWATICVTPYALTAASYYTLASRGGCHAFSSTAHLSQTQGIVRGWLPNHVFEFPFGDPMDPNDWYDVTKLGNLELRVKTGSATSGNIRTFLQQVRTY